ncbi:Dihydropteroate synthase FolP [Helicobacter bizzozeronii]|uniref:dihydropteroate synthase n=1 Tax=Helicobacter bizzozeronii TaxID=56877 RepID=UPI00244D825D|nr:dihydropteroate synthase [Helicobacter bizzozeronii]GMB92580.1 Dihydropteroate synthase FolP [Helicobacter bizzozeronii]
MFLERINPTSFPLALERIAPHPAGQKIMAKKAQLLAFKITALPLSATLILKQEALRVGAELATPKDCILARAKTYDCLLVGTLDQLQKLCQKCQTQDFGLKKLAKILQTHLHPTRPKPALMSVINLTPDSFYPHSRHNTKQALEKIQLYLEQGVEYIDIGAASSRPFSHRVEASEEIARLKEVCLEIKDQGFYTQARFSIDTYNPQSAAFALEHGFSVLNDVNGFRDQEMWRIAQAHNAQVILMHSQGVPMDMNRFDQNTHLIAEIETFFDTQIALLLEHGITDMILDVGLGFHKNTPENLALIQHLAHFLHFGYPLLVGASYKKCIGEVCERGVEDRLSGTLALHFAALQHGASILRVHDIAPHQDIIRIHQALAQVP